MVAAFVGNAIIAVIMLITLRASNEDSKQQRLFLLMEREDTIRRSKMADLDATMQLLSDISLRCDVGIANGATTIAEVPVSHNTGQITAALKALQLHSKLFTAEKKQEYIDLIINPESTLVEVRDRTNNVVSELETEWLVLENEQSVQQIRYVERFTDITN